MTDRVLTLAGRTGRPTEHRAHPTIALQTACGIALGGSRVHRPDLDSIIPRSCPRCHPARRERCGACGRFIDHASTYTNRCADCWGPEDEPLARI